MKKLALAILVALAVLIGTASTALAAAHPVATATQVDARTFAFDASASPCKWRYCTFSWRYYGPGVSRLGGTLGFGPNVLFTFRQAGTYSVVVTESEFCAATGTRACPGDAQVNVTAS